MLTKYCIEIDGIKSELPKGCLGNWDEIKCVYKRTDFSGVARSFTTQFEFVGEMYDRLMSLYLRDGVNARAVLSLYTITNQWEWVEQFSCELDFSSISWNSHTIKINCIDDSLAALIKANKGTKYEAVVDADIISDRRFVFNRLPIKNSITYEFTGGTSDEDDGSLHIGAASDNRSYMGVVNSEDVFLGGAVLWEEDQPDEAGSHMVKALKNVALTVNVDVTSDQCYAGNMRAYVVVIGSDGKETTVTNSLFVIGGNKRYSGEFLSVYELIDSCPPSSLSPLNQYWADVAGVVWECIPQAGQQAEWVNTYLSPDEYRRRRTLMQLSVNLKEGDKLAVATEGTGAHIYNSAIAISWFDKGEPVTAAAFSPRRVGQYILNKICSGKINAVMEISSHDPRIAKTVVVAAESVRGIKEAKIYTSFTEFANWMETVFGYTYRLGDVEENFVKAHKEAGGILSDEQTIETAVLNVPEVNKEDIYYLQAHGIFALFSEDKFYIKFPGAADYNDTSTGYARTDTLFKIHKYGETYDECYFIFNSDKTFRKEPMIYDLNIEDIGKKRQKVVFRHRSELFNPNAGARLIPSVRDVEYSVDNGVIYSSIEIGYDKKDYQNINGRDEFNFSNTYSTGCSVRDKKLSLISKYRADCYGIEFAAQKRGKGTTDTTSDKDVFIVYCKSMANETWVPDTTATIESAISEDVFNGEFSPLSCIDANAGFIGIQGTPLKLTFASSTGNSDVVIDDQPMSGDITLTDPLVTCGELAFSSSEIDEQVSLDDLFEVRSNGITYRGFLKEASFKYAKSETVKYKLIVKEIEL